MSTNPFSQFSEPEKYSCWNAGYISGQQKKNTEISEAQATLGVNLRSNG
jgi:hypothetical protein